MKRRNIALEIPQFELLRTLVRKYLSDLSSAELNSLEGPAENMPDDQYLASRTLKDLEDAWPKPKPLV